MKRIPAGAVLLPEAPDFSELIRMHEERPDKRQYLRVAFVFVIISFHGVMLTEARPRSLSINRRTWADGRVFVFTGTKPVPEVWVWTLADERADKAVTW